MWKENNEVNLKKKAKSYAQKVCFVIGMLGVLILTSFNWNFYLMFNGTRYNGEVVNVTKKLGECYRINVEFTRRGGEVVQEQIIDCTGESYLFWLEKGDSLSLWESNATPYKHYVPYANVAVKIFLIIFFILVPFVFMVFGKY